MRVAEEFNRYTRWKGAQDGKVQCCHIYLHMLSELLQSNSSIALFLSIFCNWYSFVTSCYFRLFASLATSCLFFFPLYLFFEMLLFVSLKQACLKMWLSVLSRDQLSHCWNIRPQSSAHATVLSDVRAPPVRLTPSLVWTYLGLHLLKRSWMRGQVLPWFNRKQS